MRTTKWVSLLLCSVVIVVASSRSGAQGLPVDGPTNLASWSFTGTVNSDQGSVPLFQTNLALSWLADGQGVLLEGSNGVSGLCYAILDGSQTNVGTGTATVSLWAAPASWASTNVAGGAGVGQVAPLFEAGGCISGTSGGGFGLFLDGSGCWLSLKARASDGSETTCFTAPVSFSTNVFKCVVVVVSPTNSVLYVDGLFATNGSGATGSQDWPVAVTNGFWLGSGPDGVQSRCMIDDVFTFGYALSSAEAQWLYDTYYWCYYLNPENPANTSLLTSAPYSTTNAGSDFRAMVGPGYLSCIGSDPNWSASDGVWMTNLSAQAGSGGATVLSFTVAGGTTNDGAVYDVLATGALASPATNCQFVWLGQVAAAGRYSVVIGSERAFLLLGTPYATNGSGLTWAQEWLLYHMDPTAGGDQNGNGIPDGWELAYFGALQPGDGDFDGDNVSNYQEWLNGTDPNKVRFSAWVTNRYVTASGAPVQLTVSGGVPASVAVLVNDTNYAHAVWQPFTSSNLVVNLGSNGDLTVSVGLRGRPLNAHQSWQNVTVTRETSPLVMGITSPTVMSGSRPLIDVTGYVARSLSGIDWTVVNSNGTAAGQGTVTGKVWNPRDRYRTTNWFSCMDVPLAAGSNWVSIVASDWAGVAAATNFAYIFDTAGATNPPALGLNWPVDGAEVAGEGFTLQAFTDDDTASLMLQYTDTNGIIQSAIGSVERGGRVWFQGVPLVPGTNVFTVTATDAAGNMSTTNLSIVQSSVSLTVNALSDEQMKYGFATVRGTVGDPAATVWVGGVEAAVDESGNWQADNVPLPSGGVVSLLVSAQSASAEAQVLLWQERGPVVFTQNYGYGLDSSLVEDGCLYVKHIGIEWARGVGGTNCTTRSGVELATGHTWGEQWTTVWPADDGYLPSLPGQVVWEAYYDGVTGSSTTNVAAAPSLESLEEASAGESWPEYQASYSEWSDFEEMVATGGVGIRQNQELLDLTTTLTRESGVNGGAPDVASAFWSWEFLRAGNPAVTVPPEQAALGALGTLGSDGHRWTLVQCGVEVPSTPRPLGGPVSAPQTSASGYKVRMFVNGTDPLAPDRLVSWGNYCVGQYMNFSVTYSPALPAAVAQTFQWNFDGSYVNAHTNAVAYGSMPDSSEVYFLNTNLLARSTTTNWWVSGGTNWPGIQYSASVSNWLAFGNGQSAAFVRQGWFNMYRPRLIGWGQVGGPVIVTNWTSHSGSVEEIHVGTADEGHAMGHMAWVSAGYSGVACWTQVYDDGSSPTAYGSNVLDIAEAYLSGVPKSIDPTYWDRNLISITDRPYEGSDPGGTNVSLVLQFRDYARFMPSNGPGPNIYVTLGKVTWDVNASATNTSGVWVLSPGSLIVPLYWDSAEFPYWTRLVSKR